MNLPNELLQLILNYLDQSTKHQLYRTTFYHLRSLSPLIIRSYYDDDDKWELSTDNKYNLYHILKITNSTTKYDHCITMIIDRHIKINEVSPFLRKLIIFEKDYIDKKIITSSVSKLILFGTRINLEFDSPIFNDITELTIHAINDLLLDHLPINLKYLEIDSYHGEPKIISIKLPQSLVTLHISLSINNCKSFCNLLPNIQMLSLGSNEIINALPESVTEIELFKKFNQNISFLPSGLKKLIVNCDFEKNLNKLPISLEVLLICKQINCKLNNLPNNLKSLIFSNTYYTIPIENLPPTLTTLILPRSYKYAIPYLPNLKKLAHHYTIKYYNKSLMFLRVYEVYDSYINKPVEKYFKYFNKKYDDIIQLPPFVKIDVNVLPKYSIDGVKKLILRNCGNYFYRVFDIDYVVITAPKYQVCSKLYANFVAGNVDIYQIVFVKGHVTQCSVISNCYDEINFCDGIKKIKFYGIASIIKCPQSLDTFILDARRNFYDDKDLNLILSKNAKIFKVECSNYCRINIPIVPSNMVYCDNRFLTSFIPAKFIGC